MRPRELRDLGGQTARVVGACAVVLALSSSAAWSYGLVKADLHTSAPHERLLAASPATDGQGNWVAAYSAAEGVRCLRSWDNATSWTDDVLIFLPTADGISTSSHAQTVTDGHGLWLTFWCTYDTLGGTKGADRDIVFASSTDNGATWSPPRLVDAGAQSDSADDAWESVATDGNGNWVCLWQSSNRAGGAPSPQDGVWCARSADNGATWDPPSLIAAFDATQYPYFAQPRLATDGTGHWAAVWTSGTVQFTLSADNGANWEPPGEPASAPEGVGRYPQVAVDSLGRIVIAYSSPGPDLWNPPDDDPSFMRWVRSADLGQSWTPPNSGSLSHSDVTDVPLSVITDNEGSWFMGGEGYDRLNFAGLMFLATSMDAGLSWFHPPDYMAYSGNGPWREWNRNLVVGCDRRGRVVGLWESSPGTGQWKMHRFYYDYGRPVRPAAGWSPATLIHPVQGTDNVNDMRPDVTYHGYGHCVAVWHHGPSATDWSILCSQRQTPVDAWTMPTPLLPDMVSTATTDADPRIACSPTGILMAVWRRQLVGGDWDIVASRSFDGGASWIPAETVNADADTDTSDDYFPSVAFDMNGGCAVAWIRKVATGDGYLMVARSPDGGDTWGPPEVAAGPLPYWRPGLVRLLETTVASLGRDWLATGVTQAEVYRSYDYLAGESARLADGATSWTPVAPGFDPAKRYATAIGVGRAGDVLALYSPPRSPGSRDYEMWSAASSDSAASWLPPVRLSGNATNDDTFCVTTDNAGKWRAAWCATTAAFPPDSPVGTHVLLSESTDMGTHWTPEAALSAGIANARWPRIVTDGQGHWTAVWQAYYGPDTDIGWTTLTEPPPSGTAARDWQMLE